MFLRLNFHSLSKSFQAFWRFRLIAVSKVKALILFISPSLGICQVSEVDSNKNCNLENYLLMIQKAKITIYLLWLAMILSGIIGFLWNPVVASPEYIVDFISRFENEMLLVYILVTIVRGFFLIPSTPFVIGGALLFPDRLFLVLALSMTGVMFSATALYYFSDFLGFSKYLEKKYPKGVARWHRRLEHPRATLFVIGWAFFPFVPTDLICYVAGIVKMPYRFLFVGVFLGELTLNIFYVYFSNGLLSGFL
jgi:uncharacterized membrane protein YdjX (TVP38/TMEM64 family)